MGVTTRITRHGFYIVHNRDIVTTAVCLFLGTYGIFRTYNRFVSPKWPTLDRHLFLRKRRIHHYEAGLYLAAIGIALFIEDMHDWILEREYLYDENTISRQAS